MRYPKKLPPGATVGLACPGSPVTAERARACIAALRAMGYRVKAAGNLAERYGGFMAGSGAARARWLGKLFADPEVDAIFCARGGGGTARCAELLDLDTVRRNPKIFVGYSDITTLHTLLNERCGLVTFHGPMVASNMLERFDDTTRARFFEAINAGSPYDCFHPPQTPPGVLKPGRARGRLAGGCLSVLAAGLGTPWEARTRGRVLFLEEVNEPVRCIERYVWQLRAAGKLAGCAGLLLGQFTGCPPSGDDAYTYLNVFADALAGIDIPVLYNIQSGHGDVMLTLPLGAMCEIDTAGARIRFFPRR